MRFLVAISALFGWVYTICWSLSFYPQPILNFRRKSTSGTTIDFPFVNVLGFIAYFVSNVAFLFSPNVREEYRLRNGGQNPTVAYNDLAFAAHAVVISSIILSQFLPTVWGFQKRTDRASRPSRLMLGITVGSMFGVALVAFIVSARQDPDPAIGWAAIDVIYAISYVKLIITIVKYMPQVLVNYRNRSTAGWSILQILLDFTGGLLSICQLAIDSYVQGGLSGMWSGIFGNPVKLALGNVSVFFDVIFIVQHYWLYRGERDKIGVSEYDPLIEREERIE